ncbi:TetR/AcrR family transcriptional regulator [Actinoplanes sp. URMC 104]|uniref:TetR/AcrR family transcriptional regulator n=1 Tax=Actinoplanes sp. URMC 104 TaxID=3423409 RepID=UPI003F19818C
MTTERYHSPRRAEAAAATRAAILEAGRRLFVTQGYASTTVPQIARSSGVAVPTVYTSTGGKADILAALLEPAAGDPSIAEYLAIIVASTDAVEIIRLTGEAVRRTHERHWETITRLFPQCQFEPGTAELYERTTQRFEAALGQVADRLIALDAVREALDRTTVHDLVWFYFGAAAWPTLIRDRGWTFDRAQEWLTEQLTTALLPHS